MKKLVLIVLVGFLASTTILWSMEEDVAGSLHDEVYLREGYFVDSNQIDGQSESPVFIEDVDCLIGWLLDSNILAYRVICHIEILLDWLNDRL